MSRQILKRYLSRPEQLQKNKYFKYLEKWIFAPNLWHFNRRTTARAIGVGLFIAFIPIPAHMLLAILAAMWTRSNLPMCISAVWFNNPLTMVPIYFFNYKVGAWLLGSPMSTVGFQVTWQWLRIELLAIWQPFLLGSVLMGALAGFFGAILTYFLWCLDVYQSWRVRKRKRAAI
ncbi:DUF2062 domain-containing protein [Candidatus Nitrosacidococcus sp. I8]|uniref:DUF2062 domain-containing protein n=1 Tax=Candidatus Nitrosacidococcus sp. I8 TaxID=2942908 RepID=UPI002226482E|nr:DUF2062 domain-containing protein [Candidatus Nitrosacidococcus sp. I8]